MYKIIETLSATLNMTINETYLMVISAIMGLIIPIISKVFGISASYLVNCYMFLLLILSIIYNIMYPWTIPNIIMSWVRYFGYS